MRPIQIYGTTPRYSQTRLSSDQKPGRDSRAAVPATGPAPAQRNLQEMRYTDWALI